MAHQSLLTGRLRAALLAAAVCALSLAFAWSAVRASDATEPYMVRHGDTLATIAAGHGITVKGLLALNPKAAEAEAVFVGESLRVPRTTDRREVPEVVCRTEYTVREGDTWESMAEARKVSADTLAAVNHRAPTAEPVAGMRLCIPAASASTPEVSTTPPAARLECGQGLQYILQGSQPVRFNYSDRVLPPGFQVCVQMTLGSGSVSLLRVKTETGATGWLSSRHVGTWEAYLASLEPSVPTRTPRPTRTPTPVPTATPTAAACRDAWLTGVSAQRCRD